MTQLRLAACLSLTGRYARFGHQAANGLKAWQTIAGGDVALRIEDDGSDRDRLADGLRRMAADGELLLGPYSTQLMREAGRVMADIDAVLWNHGGSGDDVQQACAGRIVSVLAPTTRYAEPFVRELAAVAPRAPLWVVRGRGRFARQVAAGALRQAERAGLEAIEKTAAEGPWFDEVPEAWNLFSVGTFEDDVAIVNEARSAPSSPSALCSIAAGVRDFASLVERPDGIYGVAQWFPGRAEHAELGPSERDFLAAYRGIAGSWPDYPAVQAAAAAVLAVHSARVAGSVEPRALWGAATSLDTTTLFGAFGIDALTGVQTRQTPVLLRWRSDEPRLAT
jgi:Periplasmic binding protein